jgi:hypothetical protein
MKNKPAQYTESKRLWPNVFLIFFGYVTLLLVIANISPVSYNGYRIFFLLGLLAFFILFIKVTYQITIRNNILEVSVKIGVRMIVKKLDLKEIESAEQISIDHSESPFKVDKNTHAGEGRFIKTTPAVKVRMLNKTNYIISTNNPHQLIQLLLSIHK